MTLHSLSKIIPFVYAAEAHVIWACGTLLDQWPSLLAKSEIPVAQRMGERVCRCASTEATNPSSALECSGAPAP